MIHSQLFDKKTPEDTVAAFVDSIKHSSCCGSALVELLPEQHALYTDRSTNETIRIRGYILAAFEQLGLPDAALPYVLEELESGRDAYLVAGAAKAVRGLGEPMPQVIPFLLKAIENIKYVDDALTFECYKPLWPISNHTTALREIFKTFEWLGPSAHTALADLEALYQNSHDFSASTKTEIKRVIKSLQASQSDTTVNCCSSHIQLMPSLAHTPEKRYNLESIVDIELEDQNGTRLKYGQFFNTLPSIVVFFYSRCNNPNKCSLTITKLATLQKLIQEEGLEECLKTAAITYDPEYDLPARLKVYGENRGVLFSNNNRFLRTRAGLKELQKYFELGVNYNNSIVNRHRIELFILDSTGKIVTTFARLQWDIDEVFNQAKLLINNTAMLDA